MAIPYDEIEQTKKRKETKNVSVNNNGDDNQSLMEKKRLQVPSNVMNNEHSIQAPKSYQQSIINTKSSIQSKFSSLSDIYFIAIVACVSTIAIFSVIGAGYCFYKVQQSNKAAADVDFPAYGVIGPVSRNDGNDGNKCTSPNNDRKLVQKIPMHQKNSTLGSDIESDEENEDGEYTVYECPGLAPTGEMEIKNPLFQDDITPMSSPSVNGSTATSKDTTPKDNDSKQSINNQQQKQSQKFDNNLNKNGKTE
ncbi:hypothetical protein HUG17_5518 [Dermatophagoides farinae]|uniref:Uncharacterized protein n=1 Tax=Dermatophagoides farinae TaxID=6954 RepID=A0A9D4SI73_DERFA|nr:hypothetical protein HUG17_5518 [Dermatophagoides farinae]